MLTKTDLEGSSIRAEALKNITYGSQFRSQKVKTESLELMSQSEIREWNACWMKSESLSVCCAIGKQAWWIQACGSHSAEFETRNYARTRHIHNIDFFFFLWEKDGKKVSKVKDLMGQETNQAEDKTSLILSQQHQNYTLHVATMLIQDLWIFYMIYFEVLNVSIHNSQMDRFRASRVVGGRSFKATEQICDQNVIGQMQEGRVNKKQHWKNVLTHSNTGHTQCIDEWVWSRVLIKCRN